VRAAAAAQAGFVVEADVHVFRGRVEVRHEKVLRPFGGRWERWYVLPSDAPRPLLGDILNAVGPRATLLLDLKCLTQAAARRIRAEVPDSVAVVVSSRSWWTLAAFADRADTPMLRSCGNRLQRWVGVRWPGLGERVGLTAHERLLTPEIVARIRRRTPHVYSWAVTSRGRGDALIDSGLSGVVLDDPAGPASPLNRGGSDADAH